MACDKLEEAAEKVHVSMFKEMVNGRGSAINQPFVMSVAQAHNTSYLMTLSNWSKTYSLVNSFIYGDPTFPSLSKHLATVVRKNCQVEKLTLTESIKKMGTFNQREASGSPESLLIVINKPSAKSDTAE